MLLESGLISLSTKINGFIAAKILENRLFWLLVRFKTATKPEMCTPNLNETNENNKWKDWFKSHLEQGFFLLQNCRFHARAQKSCVKNQLWHRRLFTLWTVNQVILSGFASLHEPSHPLPF